jgi:hypothetical protein
LHGAQPQLRRSQFRRAPVISNSPPSTSALWSKLDDRQGFHIESLEQRALLSASPTSLALAPSSQSVLYGQTVTLTATVTSTSTVGEGTVTFTSSGNTLGTAPVTGGIATLGVSVLPLGANGVAASYSDTAGTFASSTNTLSPASTIFTVAGVNERYAGDGGAATAAAMNYPNGIAMDAAGDLFVADTVGKQPRHRLVMWAE